MLERGGGPKNKVELESQVLCAALRQSWATRDAKGAVTSARELYQLFPDLLPPPKLGTGQSPMDFYELLGVKQQASVNVVTSAFLRNVKRYLRSGKAKEQKEAYNRVLDAGFILRKARLRLSHDLMIVRHWLIAAKAIPEDGTLEAAEQAGEEASEQLSKTQPLVVELPKLVQLLKEAQFIGPAEIQALTAQMALAPEIPIERLVLDSGYVTQQEMNSLKLAELLLEQGKITMAQFQVAIYDERTSGIRMAESLQVRGWLPVEVSPRSDDRKNDA
jgi:hypothetical protein